MIWHPIGGPEDWVVRHGRPARAVENLISYEHEDGKLVVIDTLLAQVSLETTAIQLRLFSTWYGIACILAPDGMVPLHHDPDAWWEWRPCLYRLHAGWEYKPYWERMGSQQELRWRKMLSDWMHHEHGGVAWTFADADFKARVALSEMLSPQQRLEFQAEGSFRVRGAQTKNIYRIHPGNGFTRESKTTGKIIASYCLHPEEYIPDDDVALATKLGLEDPEMEEEILKGARETLVPRYGVPTAAQRKAAKLELELIA